MFLLELSGVSAKTFSAYIVISDKAGNTYSQKIPGINNQLTKPVRLHVFRRIGRFIKGKFNNSST